MKTNESVFRSTRTVLTYSWPIPFRLIMVTHSMHSLNWRAKRACAPNKWGRQAGIVWRQLQVFTVPVFHSLFHPWRHRNCVVGAGLFFLYRLLCVSSQMSAFSSARCRAGRPLGNLVTGQSSTICIIVCFGAPQSQQVGSVICCKRVRLAAHRP